MASLIKLSSQIECEILQRILSKSFSFKSLMFWRSRPGSKTLKNCLSFSLRETNKKWTHNSEFFFSQNSVLVKRNLGKVRRYIKRRSIFSCDTESWFWATVSKKKWWVVSKHTYELESPNRKYYLHFYF